LFGSFLGSFLRRDAAYVFQFHPGAHREFVAHVALAAAEHGRVHGHRERRHPGFFRALDQTFRHRPVLEDVELEPHRGRRKDVFFRRMSMMRKCL